MTDGSRLNVLGRRQRLGSYTVYAKFDDASDGLLLLTPPAVTKSKGMIAVKGYGFISNNPQSQSNALPATKVFENCAGLSKPNKRNTATKRLSARVVLLPARAKSRTIKFAF